MPKKRKKTKKSPTENYHQAELLKKSITLKYHILQK